MRDRRFTSMRWVKIVFFFLLGILIGYAFALFLSQASNYVALVSLAISSVIAIGIPIWREYFVTKSKLSVELNSIERNVSEGISIDLREYTVFSQLFSREIINILIPNPPGIPFPLLGDNTENRNTAIREGIKELYSWYESLKKGFNELPQKIEEAKESLEKLNKIEPKDFSAEQATSFDWYISGISPSLSIKKPPMYIGFAPSPEEFKEPEQRQKKYDDFKDRLENIVERFNQTQRSIQSSNFSIQEAEETIKKIEKDLTDNRSKFSISVSLVNSGRLNTAIKVPAVLRVYIARGTYVNLELTMKDTGSQSEISANSARFVFFESKEIAQLPEDDRNLINRYWESNVYCTFFLEDIRGQIHKSDPIVFAPGVYKKIIYDRLANAAASYNPWSEIH